MVSKGSGRIVLWPQYFDRSLSRAQGRRVPSSLAVREPDAAWIETVAQKLGYDCELEGDARHPLVPYEKAGRVLVAKDKPKEAVVRAVGERMHASQATRDAERQTKRR